MSQQQFYETIQMQEKFIMSMDRCADCGVLIDTDYAPDSYREEWTDRLGCNPCLCDNCYDARLNVLEAMNEEKAA